MFYSTKIGFTVGRANDDQVEITEEHWSELVIGQAGGKVIVANESGYPELSAPEPLTDAQQTAIAEQQKQQLISEAQQSISLLQTRLLMGRALTDEEKQKVTTVLDYIDEVEAINTSTIPVSFPPLVV
ncbi:tail fiber assembly protein [Kluyvera ascorbata]|uniref:tail fiber assembly protein n=1 Tax=Kluyvera ascorbata TaxID=51288 RepID=UPI00242F95CC|nr:tail fiber assembly protein [Kluyvera ascorbata]